MSWVRDVWDALGDSWHRNIIDDHKQPQVVLLVFFVVTFIVVRFITHSIRDHRFSRIFHNMSAGGRHLHHLVPGIILMMVSGYLLVALPQPEFPKEPLAAAFGIGMALTLDEFALWFNLADDYWTPQGRESIKAVMIATGILALGVVGFPFWIDVFRILAGNH